MKRILSIIMAVVIIMSSNITVFASSEELNPLEDFKTLYFNKVDSVTTELVENNGILSFFYHDSLSEETLVISQSKEAGVNAHYNDGKSVYQISNLDNIDLKNISSNEDIIILAKKFIDDYNNSKYKNAKKVFDLVDRVNEISIEEHEISNVRSTFYSINAKVAQILETKNINIKQVNLIKALEGDTFGLIFATFAMSPKLATTLGIITVFIN